jgi:hypothetical protein
LAEHTAGTLVNIAQSRKFHIRIESAHFLKIFSVADRAKGSERRRFKPPTCDQYRTPQSITAIGTAPAGVPEQALGAESPPAPAPAIERALAADWP